MRFATTCALRELGKYDLSGTGSGVDNGGRQPHPFYVAEDNHDPELPRLRPRELRITTLHRDNDRVPWIRIAGHWLADLGLTSGSRVVITTEPGKLTLTLYPPG